MSFSLACPLKGPRLGIRPRLVIVYPFIVASSNVGMDRRMWSSVLEVFRVDLCLIELLAYAILFRGVLLTQP